MAASLCGGTQSGSRATKIVKTKPAEMIKQRVMGRNGAKSTAPPNAISTGMVPQDSLLWILVVAWCFFSYIITGRNLLAEIV